MMPPQLALFELLLSYIVAPPPLIAAPLSPVDLPGIQRRTLLGSTTTGSARRRSLKPPRRALALSDCVGYLGDKLLRSSTPASESPLGADNVDARSSPSSSQPCAPGEEDPASISRKRSKVDGKGQPPAKSVRLLQVSF